MLKNFFKRKVYTGEAIFADKPWEEISPEEYMARNWLRYDCLDTEGLEFKNKKMKAWADRAAEIFNDHEKLEVCRKQFLSDEELKEEAVQIERVQQNGI
tara:strand:- start:77 stop:373 length:297 start_codon:yes stop_codon:yes gene_type:complete